MDRIRRLRSRNRDSHGLANLKFEDLFDRYRKEVEADLSLKPASKSARIHSVIRIEKTWPELLRMRPSRIQKSDVADWVRKLSTVGSGFVPPGASKARQGNSESAVRKAIQTLSRIMESAVDDGLAAENVVKKVSKDRKLFKGKKTETAYIPTRAELEAIGAEISKGDRGEGRAFALRFLAYSGCRIEEARSLVWRDVDFCNRELYVRGTKTDASDRVLPMIPNLVEMLKERHEGLLEVATFEELDQVEVLPIGNLNKPIAEACQKLGIPRRRRRGHRNSITNHSLRHYFATTCLDKGAQVPTVAKWMGHSDGGVLLLRTYSHYLEDFPGNSSSLEVSSTCPICIFIFFSSPKLWFGRYPE